MRENRDEQKLTTRMSYNLIGNVQHNHKKSINIKTSDIPGMGGLAFVVNQKHQGGQSFCSAYDENKAM